MRARGRAAASEIEIAAGGACVAIARNARTDLYNTFRVGGPSDFLARAGSPDEVALVLGWAREQGLPVSIFGGGSNLLVSDKGVRGLVVVVRRPGKSAKEALEVVAEDDTHVVVRAPAAAPTTWFGRTAAHRGWQGMAWAVGLPGNVGGALVNNAGAHGGEMTDHLVSFRAVGPEGALAEYARDWLEPRYRFTRVKANQPRDTIVLDATFRFVRGLVEELAAEAEEYAAYRHRTQPTGACAGSIFKNPPGTYSGLLIEQAGLKGLRVGGAVVSDKHANFIVNEGNATAADIIGLMERIQDEVERQTGVRLEPEIERIGDWS